MYFSYSDTRDWLKIKWHDQSCMKLEVVEQRCKWSATANDPRTGNDPQIGPQKDPEPEMIPDVDRK